MSRWSADNIKTEADFESFLVDRGFAPTKAQQISRNGFPEIGVSKLDVAEEIKSGVEAIKSATFDRFATIEERQDQIETALKRAGTSPGPGEIRPTMEQKAFASFIRRGPESVPELERKSLVIADDTSGGYLATPQFSHEVVKNLVLISPVRQAARVGQMTASEILIPRRTAAPTGYWVGETDTRAVTQSAYGQARITANEMAAYVDVSQQLLEDAAIDVNAEVAMDLAEEFARLEGSAFVNGDGIKKPVGFMSAAGVSYTAQGEAATMTNADPLITMFYSLPAFYRGRATWMMNSTTLGIVRKLKDGEGQYLWSQGLQAGEPSTLLGRPVIDAPDMPDVGAGLFPVAVGDFNSGYRIYDRVAMSLLRDPFTQATLGLVRFHARRRVGGDVVKPEAIRKLKIASS